MSTQYVSLMCTLSQFSEHRYFPGFTCEITICLCGGGHILQEYVASETKVAKRSESRALILPICVKPQRRGCDALVYFKGAS